MWSRSAASVSHQFLAAGLATYHRVLSPFMSTVALLLLLPSVLALPPARCNENLPPERSALTCEELLEAHFTPSAEEAAEEAANDDDVFVIEPHAPLPCAGTGVRAWARAEA